MIKIEKLRFSLVVSLLLGVFIYGCQVIETPNTFAQGNVRTQGFEVMGVQSWHDAGILGQGVKVAIWDFGFYEFDQLIGTDLPPAERLTTQTFGSPIQGEPEEIQSDPDGPRHGTAVAEIVFDIAPQADFYLLATSSETNDMMSGLQWLIAQEVDVVVASLSLPDHGCLDVGESAFEPIFAQMRAAGILLVTSSGNDRTAHWQGVFEDVDDDGYLDFTASDDGITFEAFEGDVVDLILSWDDPCFTSPNDFDLLLFDEFGDLVGESLEVNSTFGAQEILSIELPADGEYDIVIEKISGQNVLLDLVWANGPEFEHAVVDGSISFFEPAISPNAMTVGSINWSTLNLEESSSQGPTKDGRIKPNVVAPTCVVSIAYGGSPSDFNPDTCGFSGTSAAAPHAAGAAVLVKQANPSFTPDQIQGFLENNARDFGVSGFDNIYGWGLIVLPEM
jgi:subtilisin family serine protease